MPNQSDLPKAYEPQSCEDSIYAAWEKSGFFNPDNLPGERKETFSIMMPPPNVTGVLHLGHALENALMDAMARYQRLNGKKVLLVPGTDHAALPTQAKVEKMLMEGGMKNPRQELGREKLVEKIREFAEASRATILGQVKKMGTSCDWSRLAYTFDKPRNIAVNELFRQMYNDGLIYRGYRVVNWSIKGQSTCSDDEIEHIERTSVLYTFKYSKDFPITIATTQPETKLGDTAVAVHPDDERYQKYIGQIFVVDVGAEKPLEIKIIADENVDPEFGTGALGVTPAHSQVDFVMYEKQKASGNPIGMIQVIGTDGKMTKEAGVYAGLTTEEARVKFVDWLIQQGLLEKEPEEIAQNVGIHGRYKDVIEVLPMTQWWLNVQKVVPSKGKSLRDLMREALTTGLGGDAKQRVVVTPERFTKLYLDRVDNLRDWCLSRQTWWGHRIPVWYRGDETFVGIEAPDGEGWQQDPDTLDTWFSSGSWTFSTLGWPEQTKDLIDYHPTSWMQMGYEILYLWLMRMVLMSTYTLDEIPFRDAYIHGMLRNENGKKFSKSDANGIDPLDIIEKYGCDALRLCVLSGNTPGNDSRFSIEKIESSRNFVNKLWNISRYILSAVENVKVVENIEVTTLADKWILQRMGEVTQKTSDLFEHFDFSLAIEELRNFTWTDFADWYLEISKIQKKQPELVASTDVILIFVLKNLLKLWHPLMPFVTEELWKNFGSEKMLIVEDWPEVKVFSQNNVEFERLKEIIEKIRNWRAENKVEPKEKVNLTLIVGECHEIFQDEINLEIIKTLARVENLIVEENLEKTFNYQFKVDRQIDTEKERERLSGELENLKNYIVSLDTKLANQEFIAKAPAKVVDELKQKRDDAAKKAEAIKQQMENL